MKISTIVDHIDSGHMALPEFQRKPRIRAGVRGRAMTNALGAGAGSPSLHSRLAPQPAKFHP